MMSDDTPPAITGQAGAQPQPICCSLRRKVALVPLVLSERVCGVADVELADVLQFGSENALRARFCPWCGAALAGQQAGITARFLPDGSVSIKLPGSWRPDEPQSFTVGTTGS